MAMHVDDFEALETEGRRRRRRTREELVGKWTRPGVPIRRALVQGGTLGQPEPGPLAGMVGSHDVLALDLLLTAHAVAVGGAHDVARPSMGWARAVGSDDGEPSASTISRAWARLRSRKLVSIGRHGRMASITLLREDGSGDPYSHPGKPRGGAPGEAYFKLNHAYWLEGYIETLRLPGKAVLLILLSLKDWAVVPLDKAPKWYGISPDTFERGVTELKAHRLLTSRKRLVEAPLSPTFYTVQLHYRLLPPFAEQPSAQELRDFQTYSPGAKSVP